MSSKLTLMILAACFPVLAGVPKQSVEVVTTDRVDFAAGGTIRVEGSAGDLNIEAWDEPRIEITVTRSTFVKDTTEARDRMTRELKGIRITAAQGAAKWLSPPRGGVPSTSTLITKSWFRGTPAL